MDENEPDFWNMTTEQVNEYLIQHGYDPEAVALMGRTVAAVAIENVQLKDKVSALEHEIERLRAAFRRIANFDKWASENTTYLEDIAHLNRIARDALDEETK